MTPLVEIKDLRKLFDLGQGQQVHAVDGVSLDIFEREIVGLVGESGSGKSTLGKTILGLHNKTSGSIRFRDQMLPSIYRSSDFQAQATKMQMIFQDPYSSLNPRMTVGEIIGEGLRMHSKLDKAALQQKVHHWLSLVGLSPDHGGRYPHEFSGGQRQRIGIARALIMEPEFVVCDEPISALDVSVQAQVVNLLGRLSQELGLTLLFIAHDLSMVRYVSHRMAVMYLGKLVEIGPADQVYFSPKHPYSQTLIASNPQADPNIERSRASTTIQGEIPSPINVPTGCRFADRCPSVMPVCRSEEPALIPLEKALEPPGDDPSSPHQIACHLY